MLAIIILFILFISIVLFAKVNYSLKLKVDDGKLEYSAGINWIFKAFKLDISDSDLLIYIFGKKINNIIRKTQKKQIKSSKKVEKKQKVKLKKHTFLRKIGKVYDNIKKSYKKAKKSEIKEILALILLYLKRTLKCFLPKSMDGLLVVGMDSPDKTGVLLAVLYGISISFKNDVIIKGNFEEPIIFVDINAKGSLSIWAVLLINIKFVFAKPIRKLWLKKRKRKV